MIHSIHAKGVTTSYTRHLGADTQNITGKGYAHAMKTALGVDNVDKAKEQFKKAGLKTGKFDSKEIIRQNEMVRDLDKLARAGVLKRSVQSAFTDIRKEQVKEHLSLKNRERRDFQNLHKTAKKQLLWGRQSESLNLSPGAQIAYDETKKREFEMLKTRFGIVGYDAMRANEDLGKKIKVLDDIRYKTDAAKQELQKLKIEEVAIRERAKKRPDLLERYGLMRMQRAHDSKSLEKTVAGPNVQDDDKDKDKDKEDDKDKDKDKDKDDDKKDDQPSRMSTSSSSVSVDPSFFKTENITHVPFTKLTTKIKKSADPSDLDEVGTTSEQQSEELSEKSYGFINSDDEISVEND